MDFKKPQPGVQGQYTVNQKTGLQDTLNGDHSFKNFVKIQWDWCLIWLGFFIISLLQILNLPTVIGFVTEAAANDGFFAGLMVGVGMIIWLPTLIGMTFFLRDWWLKLAGEKSWSKRIIDKK